jgi:hypothetical protein
VKIFCLRPDSWSEILDFEILDFEILGFEILDLRTGTTTGARWYLNCYLSCVDKAC